jgi:hypothetical protein
VNLLAALFGVASGVMTMSGLFFLYLGWGNADDPPGVQGWSCTRVDESHQQCDIRGELVVDDGRTEAMTMAGAALTVGGTLLGLGYAVVASTQWALPARRPVAPYAGMSPPG